MSVFVLIQRGDEDTDDKVLGVYQSCITPQAFIDDLCEKAKQKSIAEDERYNDGAPFWTTQVYWIKQEYQIIEQELLP